MTDSCTLTRTLLEDLAIDDTSIPWSIHGDEPVWNSPIPLAPAAVAVLTAAGVAAAAVWRDRTGEGQEVDVDLVPAAATLNSHVFQRVEGRDLGDGIGALSSYYQCRDGAWLHTNGGLPHLAQRMLQVLDCGPTAGQLSRAIGQRDSDELEQALADAGACGSIARTREAWLEHPQGATLARLPLVQVQRTGDSPPEPAGDDRRPFGGLRVLELARILAGPTAGRLLAEQGADVLMVTGPFVPHVMRSVVDTNHGKRSTYLDIEAAPQRARLLELVQTADVVTDGYRPGALEARGLGMADLQALRPGLIHLTVSCYGDEGPWRSRPGFEPMAEAVAGLALAHSGTDRPEDLPAAACDYLTGFLGALGVSTALARRAREGGSYRVSVSLSRTAMWLAGLPARDDAAGATGPGDVARWMIESATSYGMLRHFAPVAHLSRTPGRYDQPNPAIGAHPPQWWEARVPATVA